MYRRWTNEPSARRFDAPQANVTGLLDAATYLLGDLPGAEVADFVATLDQLE
jgi:hypothetical protein